MERLSQRIQEHWVKFELLMKDIHDCETKRYMTKMLERMNIDDKQEISQQVGDKSQNADVSKVEIRVETLTGAK